LINLIDYDYSKNCNRSSSITIDDCDYPMSDSKRSSAITGVSFEFYPSYHSNTGAHNEDVTLR